jgi:hypothetical protein
MFLLLFMALYGGVKTFQRNWILALILLIFLTGLWFFWALVECFTGPVKPAVYNVRIVNDDDPR